MTLDIKSICQGLPGLSITSGHHLYEGCVVCLTRSSHKHTGTDFLVHDETNTTVSYRLIWDDIFNSQLDRTWADQFYATEHGAVCLAILIALKMTNYTVIAKSARKNGFDYWLGNKDDILFQNKARLEVSGIFKGNRTDINKRFKIKLNQTNQSASLKLPGYIGIVEFSNPTANFSAI